jgi:hypothetical protein
MCFDLVLLFCFGNYVSISYIISVDEQFHILVYFRVILLVLYISF